MSHQTIETSVLVIGGGPGGYVAAIRAAQRGLETTLVERDAYGGTCLNHGCIPSKALITAASVASDAANAEDMGIYADPTVDMAEMASWKDSVVDQLTGGVEQLCKANGVDLIDGTATFRDEHTARIAPSADDPAPDVVEFDYAIVATGSRPVSIPGFDLGDGPIWSSRDALAAAEIPDSLVTVGAGYIGMELSTMFAKLGTDVTIVEMLDDALPAYEDDVTRAVRSHASDLGIEFHFEEGASEWERRNGGITVRTATVGGDVSSYDADRVLVAVGREPVADTLDIESVGLEPNDDGFIPTDETGRTALDHVFAVGDVAGEPMLAHKASAEGLIAVEAILDEGVTLDRRAVPAAVFTDPEVATVGLTEAEAIDEGLDVVVGQMPLRANGRALTMDEPDGFVRVVAEADERTVVGAQIVAPEASELIAALALAVETGATLNDLAETVHTHPTLSEATMEAAANALGEAIHTINN